MTTPTTQLEIAAHWLREAAIDVTDSALKRTLSRVADECERTARNSSVGADK